MGDDRRPHPCMFTYVVPMEKKKLLKSSLQVAGMLSKICKTRDTPDSEYVCLLLLTMMCPSGGKMDNESSMGCGVGE